MAIEYHGGIPIIDLVTGMDELWATFSEDKFLLSMNAATITGLIVSVIVVLLIYFKVSNVGACLFAVLLALTASDSQNIQYSDFINSEHDRRYAELELVLVGKGADFLIRYKDSEEVDVRSGELALSILNSQHSGWSFVGQG